MVTCGLTAYTPGSAPDPMLGIEYGSLYLLPFTYIKGKTRCIWGADKLWSVETKTQGSIRWSSCGQLANHSWPWKQPQKQASWFLRSDCAPSFERQQFRMPAELRSLHAGAGCWLLLHSASSDRIPFDQRGVDGMANFKIYFLRKFCSNRVRFFLQYTGDTDAKKMMDHNFEIQIL